MDVDVEYPKCNGNAVEKAVTEDDDYDYDEDDATSSMVTPKRSGGYLFRGHYGSDDDLQCYTGSFLCDSMSTLL